MFKRALMAGATAFIAVNLWTGAPLFALWVGSKVVGHQTLSMSAVGVVVVVLAVLLYCMTTLLQRMNTAYDRLAGRETHPHQPAWMRGLGVEGEDIHPRDWGISTIERIVMVSVYVAVIAFLVWFFFLAGSPLLY